MNQTWTSKQHKITLTNLLTFQFSQLTNLLPKFGIVWAILTTVGRSQKHTQPGPSTFLAQLCVDLELENLLEKVIFHLNPTTRKLTFRGSCFWMLKVVEWTMLINYRHFEAMLINYRHFEAKELDVNGPTPMINY
jgi:hypothetical protein